jgi:Carboxypeptidase regulatory-like domain
MAAALLMAAVANSAWAQNSSLRGKVFDESGAVVPNARVSVALAGGKVQTTTGDAKGDYAFRSLPPGRYSVQAFSAKLATEQPVAIELAASGAQTLDLVVKISATVQQLDVVEDAGPAISVDPASNAGAIVLRGEDLQALSDDPDDLMADLQALAGPSAGPSGGAMFVDGFSGGELPPKGSIREIRINQDPFSPEYDKLGYGRIEIFTKPGARRYSGNLNYNFANDFWNSRNPYAPEKAPFTLHEFEGGSTGPITKRSSFTLDAQRNAVDNGFIVNAVTLNPQTLAIQPFSQISVTPQRYTRLTPRLDYALNDSNTLSVRYGFTHGDINGAGIGGFDLESRAYHTKFTLQTLQLTETAIIGTSVNETRFQCFRNALQQSAKDMSPSLQVLGSFNGGGSPLGLSSDTQDSFEFQNYTSIVRKSHSWKFGVRVRGQLDDSVSPQGFNGGYSFGGGLAPELDANFQPTGAQIPISSIERYQRTLQLQQAGYLPAAIRALGGGATQFTLNAGTQEVSVGQADVGLFGGDNWRARQNLTVSYGLRYETQTNIHDWRDFAPRLSFAWSPAKAKKKTVVRAGFGTFYDRFALSNTLAAERYNGVVQQQYVIANPDFFPIVPPPSALTQNRSGQSSQVIDSNLRASYILQSAVTVERQLAANTTIAVTYTNAHALHVLRSVNINTPLPGTYDPNIPGSGVLPLGRPGAVFLTQSSGLYNQNQLVANMNSRLNANISVFGFYVLSKAMSNTDGVSTSPANPYRYDGEYGPAATDVRHRVTFGGSLNLRWNIRMSPFFVIQSRSPFNITSGNDQFGTTIFNSRPGIATDPNKPGVIQTEYGLLDPNPTASEPIVPRNYGRGPAQILMNLRVGKTIGFGPEKGGGNNTAAAQVSAAPVAAAGGSGLRGLISAPTTPRRYNLSFSMSVRNLLNHNNPGPVTGNITSPLFGQSNQTAGNINGEGFSENANNRRLELQIKFTF